MVSPTTLNYYYQPFKLPIPTLNILFIALISISIICAQQQKPPPLPDTPFNTEQQQEEIIMAIIVEAGHVECLYQPITNSKYHSFELDYQVIQGGDNDITLSIKSPNGVMIVNDLRKTDGSHKISLDEPQNGRGDYAICFDNTFSYNSAKRIFFEIFLLDKDGNYLSDYNKKIARQGYGLLVEQLENFDQVTSRVKSNLNKVERMQSQFRAVEARDRSSIETAFERINFWSAVNFICLIFAAAVQVYMVRSLFIEDSRLGRFVRHGKFK